MFLFFFFNDTATTEIYTLSLHDALPILEAALHPAAVEAALHPAAVVEALHPDAGPRSEEHTSELQSQSNLVCRLLLEKKKTHEQVRTHDSAGKVGVSAAHVRAGPTPLPR